MLRRFFGEPVAQAVEQRTFNARVESSSLSRLTSLSINTLPKLLGRSDVAERANHIVALLRATAERTL